MENGIKYIKQQTTVMNPCSGKCRFNI